MASLPGQYVRHFIIAILAACLAGTAFAAPYAAIVMDARTGETLYATNADTRLHPASLTKMMTLYVAFEAIRRGELSLDTMVTVSKKAAAEPPSRLGLKPGQRIALRYLIRAAAIKSGNDAATAIGEAVSGSEAAFAERMNRTARALGMNNTTFRNAHGLTASGHLSTARDMNTMGRRLFFDFPEYYNIFSRRSADAGVAAVNNTNRRFLDSYRGADGIKTGFTNAAGFNLTASAERGNKRIIATVFGGQSTAHRNARIAELLDRGFNSAPANAPIRKPGAPDYGADALVASAGEGTGPISAGKTLRLVTAVARSPRPVGRPSPAAEATEIVTAMQAGISEALASATAPVAAEPETLPFEVVVAPVVAEAAPEQEAPAAAPVAEEVTLVAAAPAPPPDTRPVPRPVLAPVPVAEVEAEAVQLAAAILAPPPAPPVAAMAEAMAMAEAPLTAPDPAEPEIVTRMSTSGGRHWGVTLGRFPSRSAAERTLMTTALSESATLNDGLRKVVQRGGGFDANFMGLTQEQADLACRRLQARAVACFAIGP